LNSNLTHPIGTVTWYTRLLQTIHYTDIQANNDIYDDNIICTPLKPIATGVRRETAIFSVRNQEEGHLY